LLFEANARITAAMITTMKIAPITCAARLPGVVVTPLIFT
jgi:hypothetical protein